MLHWYRVEQSKAKDDQGFYLAQTSYIYYALLYSAHALIGPIIACFFAKQSKVKQNKMSEHGSCGHKNLTLILKVYFEAIQAHMKIVPTVNSSVKLHHLYWDLSFII